MDQKELNSILELHKKWLYNEKGGKRADLCGADMCGADLEGANLYRANLRGADLEVANLYRADLEGANLCGADLYRANLRGADMCGADMCGADLRGADLEGANLYRANLRGADLEGANLEGAKNADSASAQTVIVPEGQIIGYKKVRMLDNSGFHAGSAIVKLLIPGDAKRSNAAGRKCRASKAVVLEITDLYGNPLTDDRARFVGILKSGIEYEVGKTVYPDSFDENRWNECSNGIHFFITRQEAVDY